MLQKLQNHLNKNFPFLKGSKLLITVSGGIDSIVLTHLFHELKNNIGIAHCNFQLRGPKSDLDECFVKKTAFDLNITFHNIKFSTKEYCIKNKVNTQIGARELRYNWFHELQQEFEYDYILTAHHLNDVMETFFINLSRGTGIDGLASIPAINKNIIRPLLVFSRKEIENYAIDNNIKWREDKSNAETKYIRNKIRHNITPELYKLHPNFEENFLNTLLKIHDSKNFIKQKISAIQKSIFSVQKDNILIDSLLVSKLSDFEIYELFKAYGFNTSQEIKKLILAQTGKQIHSTTHTILKNRGTFILSQKKDNKDSDVFYTIKHREDTGHLPIALSFSSKPKNNTNNCIACKKESIEFPLIVRKRKDGDFFFPTGMNGKKKISKFYKDLKLSLRDKENTWLLCNQKQEVIWIIGYRANRFFTEKPSKENCIFITVE